MASTNPKISPQTIVITIDGPAGAGKSTVARQLARHLGFAYLDTGAMYRALTLKAIRRKVNLEDEKSLAGLARETQLDLTVGLDKAPEVLLDGVDVSTEIRTLEVTNNAFYIARAPSVREILVKRQQEIGAKANCVLEGRDTGTVVFPHAAYKFYLDADFKERARRRIDELKLKGKAVDESALSRDLNDRDERDFSRRVGPLKKADDAIVIDSTHLSIEQVVEKILGYLE